MSSKRRNEKKPTDIGFVFHKFFPGHGWFEGRVTQIRLNAEKNKTRRIVYEDGDVEDVTVQCIRKSVESYKKYLRIESSKKSKAKKRMKATRVGTSDTSIANPNTISASDYITSIRQQSRRKSPNVSRNSNKGKDPTISATDYITSIKKVAASKRSTNRPLRRKKASDVIEVPKGDTKVKDEKEEIAPINVLEKMKKTRPSIAEEKKSAIIDLTRDESSNRDSYCEVADSSGENANTNESQKEKSASKVNIEEPTAKSYSVTTISGNSSQKKPVTAKSAPKSNPERETPQIESNSGVTEQIQLESESINAEHTTKKIQLRQQRDMISLKRQKEGSASSWMIEKRIPKKGNRNEVEVEREVKDSMLVRKGARKRKAKQLYSPSSNTFVEVGTDSATSNFDVYSDRSRGRGHDRSHKYGMDSGKSNSMTNAFNVELKTSSSGVNSAKDGATMDVVGRVRCQPTKVINLTIDNMKKNLNKSEIKATSPEIGGKGLASETTEGSRSTPLTMATANVKSTVIVLIDSSDDEERGVKKQESKSSMKKLFDDGKTNKRQCSLPSLNQNHHEMRRSKRDEPSSAISTALANGFKIPKNKKTLSLLNFKPSPQGARGEVVTAPGTQHVVCLHNKTDVDIVLQRKRNNEIVANRNDPSTNSIDGIAFRKVPSTPDHLQSIAPKNPAKNYRKERSSQESQETSIPVCMGKLALNSNAIFNTSISRTVENETLQFSKMWTDEDKKDQSGGMGTAQKDTNAEKAPLETGGYKINLQLSKGANEKKDKIERLSTAHKDAHAENAAFETCGRKDNLQPSKGPEGKKKDQSVVMATAQKDVDVEKAPMETSARKDYLQSSNIAICLLAENKKVQSEMMSTAHKDADVEKASLEAGDRKNNPQSSEGGMGQLTANDKKKKDQTGKISSAQKEADAGKAPLDTVDRKFNYQSSKVGGDEKKKDQYEGTNNAHIEMKGGYSGPTGTCLVSDKPTDVVTMARNIVPLPAANAVLRPNRGTAKSLVNEATGVLEAPGNGVSFPPQNGVFQPIKSKIPDDDDDDLFSDDNSRSRIPETDDSDLFSDVDSEEYRDQDSQRKVENTGKMTSSITSILRKVLPVYKKGTTIDKNMPFERNKSGHHPSSLIEAVHKSNTITGSKQKKSLSLTVIGHKVMETISGVKNPIQNRSSLLEQFQLESQSEVSKKVLSAVAGKGALKTSKDVLASASVFSGHEEHESMPRDDRHTPIHSASAGSKEEALTVEFGQVGFKFSKFFPGHGLFAGKVIEVLPYGYRRCKYDDGDIEDLTGSELRKLARLEHHRNPSVGKESLDSQMQNCSITPVATSNLITALNDAKAKADVSARDDADFRAVGNPITASNYYRMSQTPAAVNIIAVPTNSADSARCNEINNPATVHLSNATSTEISNSDFRKVDVATNAFTPNAAKQHIIHATASKNNPGSNSPSKEMTDTRESRHRKASQKKTTISSDARISDDELDFDMADDIVPLDETAESTLRLDRHSSAGSKSGSEDEEPAWLKKVATLVNSKAPKEKSKKEKKTPTITCSYIGTRDSDGTEKQIGEDQVIISLPSQISKPVPLFKVQKDFRHGCKVVNIKDKRRVVGQVLIENSGWVEVIVGEEIKKDRVSNFLAIPSTYSIGECAKDLNIFCEEVSTSPPKAKDKTRTAYTNTSDSKLHLGSIFYWYCKCKTSNPFIRKTCTGCCRDRESGRGVPSALLELVENVCIVHQGGDAMQAIPSTHRRSIPAYVLGMVQNPLKGKKLNKNSLIAADEVFYWQCTYCTFENSFRRHSCKTCRRKKSADATQSILLQIASAIAKDELYVDDAMKKVPDIHKSAIPEMVMKALVTCIATVKNTNRRCLVPKVRGSEYCAAHQSAIHLSTERKKGQSVSEKDEDSHDYETVAGQTSANPFMSIEQLLKNVRRSLRDTIPYQKNARKWRIKCMEDAFLCERNEPFPLGLIVRRFFPGHGYHDGFITAARRKEIKEGVNESRPVLLYRVKYNDGDEEDLLHHEVNSLRQIYDVRSVLPTAPSSEQIRYGTVFKTLNGKVEIISIQTNEKNPNDNGIVLATLQKPNQAEKIVELDLMKFQKFVVHKVSKQSKARNEVKHWFFSDDDTETCNVVCPEQQISRLPFMEWPPPAKNATEASLSDTDEATILSTTGLRLHKEPVHKEEFLEESIESQEDDDSSCKVHRIIDDEPCLSRRGVLQVGYDPAGVSKFISYTPFESTKCELCKSGEEDHYILICDDCDKGYHTFCLRPVVVNIPRGDWSCPRCTSVESTFTSFEDIVREHKLNQAAIYSFLNLPFNAAVEFHEKHNEAFSLLRSRQMWRSKFPKVRMSEKVGGIHISRNKDRHLFLLPEPIGDPAMMLRSLASIAAAIKYCGMEEYSEELAYERKVSESMNEAILDMDEVQTLSKKNLELFQMYKENLKVGVYPPVEVAYDEAIGFMVKALSKMKKHTIITEYVGEVTTTDQAGNTNSDSLMNLLQTGNDSTSLIIDPSRIGNMARFFSGINNRNYMSKKKANVRTRRFVLDGKCRVVLFTAKDVQAGEVLHYDYNAGIEGKSVEAMVRSGFYDTSNFL